MAKMTSTENEVLKILNNLLEFEDVYACMVAKKNIEGVVPDTDKFEPEILNVWEILRDTMNEFFEVIEQYSEAGLREVYFRLRDYEVMFFILPQSDTALVAIVPSMANKGLLEVTLEESRRKIIEVI